MVRTAAGRLGLRAVAPVVADATRSLPLRAAAFDRVLLDAPCSGLGVLRRRPEARWRLRPEQIDELAALQRTLLGRAAEAVRPGGRLVYSVCTLSAAETVAIDGWTQVHLDGFVAEPAPGAPWVAVGRGARLLPGVAGSDGMYCLILRAPG
jgi:16S rRNA (cytosine967-C5)-methyltransferase